MKPKQISIEILRDMKNRNEPVICRYWFTMAFMKTFPNMGHDECCYTSYKEWARLKKVGYLKSYDAAGNNAYLINLS